MDNQSDSLSAVQVEIQGFAFGGSAFGKLPDGKICFVRGAVPGETVKVELLSNKKKFATGRILRILNESAQRMIPVCPSAAQPGNFERACPGCSYQHVSYECEIYWKQKEFTDFMLRNKLTEPSKILPPVPAPKRYGWRNKLKLACESGPAGMQMGYRGEDNKTLLPVRQCALARKLINQELEKVGTEIPVPPEVSSIHFRWTLPDGCRTWFDLDGQSAPWLNEQIGEFGVFLVPPMSFFQVNSTVAQILLKRVCDVLGELHIKFLADLYCGIGIFSLIAAKQIGDLKCIGIELDKLAVSAAGKNAARHKLGKRCKYYAGDSAEMLKRVMPENWDLKQTAILVDPPRTGMQEEMIQKILDLRPEFIIYVSCATDTLQRDLKKITAGHYEILQTGLLDMFPATAHFESLTVLRNLEQRCFTESPSHE